MFSTFTCVVSRVTHSEPGLPMPKPALGVHWFQIIVTYIKERILGRDKNIGVGRGWVVTMSTSTSKASKTNPTSAVNNTANKLILDRGNCEKLHKTSTFDDPVFKFQVLYLNSLYSIRGKTLNCSNAVVQTFMIFKRFTQFRTSSWIFYLPTRIN